MTLMRVKALSHNPGAQLATLVLEDETGGLALGFLVPMNEAGRLARVLGLSQCRCAPIYELVLGMAARLGASVGRAVLHHEPEGICATLVLEHPALDLVLPCHPADAIALALRARAPIYATPAAVAQACPVAKLRACGTDHPDVARWLERVRPDDFGSGNERED